MGILGDISPTPQNGGERKPAPSAGNGKKPEHKPFDFSKLPMEPPPIPDPDPQDRR